MGSRHAGFSSCGLRALECGLRSCGTWTQLLRSMWDPSQIRDWTCLLHWQANSLPQSHKGIPVIVLYTVKHFSHNIGFWIWYHRKSMNQEPNQKNKFQIHFYHYLAMALRPWLAFSGVWDPHLRTEDVDLSNISCSIFLILKSHCLLFTHREWIPEAQKFIHPALHLKPILREFQGQRSLVGYSP